jgi:hypothetical protein
MNDRISIFSTFARYIAGLLAIATPLFHSHAQALPMTEPLTVTVRVEAKPEPKKAIGLVLSTGRTMEIPDTTIQKIGEKLYLISFVVDRNIVRKDTVATAMAFDENGTVSFANVSPELLSESKTLISRIPECPPEDPSSIVKLDQQGPLQQLVDVRSERAEIARLKISRMLDEQFLAKLQRFEDAFGLQKSEELSADLPPDFLWGERHGLHVVRARGDDGQQRQSL